MKKVLIMFSGGVESTALFQHAINQEYETTLMHATHNNVSHKEFTACRGIVHDLAPYTNLHEVLISKDGFDLEHRGSHPDVAIWMSVAMACVGRGEWDEVWYGNHNKDNQHKVANMEESWYAMMKILKLDTILVSPLRLKSKLDLYNSLSPKTKRSIVYCSVIPKGAWNKPCGECGKCQEFKQYVTDRM